MRRDGLWSSLRHATAWSAAARAGMLAFGWWAITEGDSSSLVFGAPVVLVATLASLGLRQPGHSILRPLAAARLALAFVFRSFRGGVDVAGRALRPRIALRPAFIVHRSQLQTGPALNLFAAALSLMPGTLTVRMEGQSIHIHVLVDRGERVRRDLEELEQLVAAAFGAASETR